MPDLLRVLSDYDLGLLRVIAAHWRIELDVPGQREAVEALVGNMLQPDHLAETIAGLPPDARVALEAVARAGRVPLAPFVRRYGELRAMGPARRDREQPWANDSSTLESLWYRGLIATAFFDDGPGPREFALIADDLRPLIPVDARTPQPSDPPGAPAKFPPGSGGQAMAAWPSEARDLAASDAATLLAYLQIAPVRLEGASLPPRHHDALSRYLRVPEALDLFLHLAIHLGLASDSPLKLDPARARPFLESAPPAQMRALAQAWRESREWNDLLHVPGLVFEGKAWRNDPLSARQALLSLLAEVPVGEWWSLDAFVAAVKERHPDFQRPAGDYDSWYIRDAATTTYLRGFEHWDRVDGALARWIITRPMVWLGLVELVTAPGTSANAGAPSLGAGEVRPAVNESAFRIISYGAAFLGHAEWPDGDMQSATVALRGPPSTVVINPDGTLRLPAAASAYDRFQLSRVSDWLPLLPVEEGYAYRLSPASLARAAKQGIGIGRIIAFLQRAAGEEALPPALVGALHRWERHGAEAAVKETVVLKLKSPELLQTLQRTPAVRRYLGEALGPAAVEVRREDVARLREALAEVGILLDE